MCNTGVTLEEGSYLGILSVFLSSLKTGFLKIYIWTTFWIVCIQTCTPFFVLNISSCLCSLNISVFLGRIITGPLLTCHKLYVVMTVPNPKARPDTVTATTDLYLALCGGCKALLMKELTQFSEFLGHGFDVSFALSLHLENCLCPTYSRQSSNLVYSFCFCSTV